MQYHFSLRRKKIYKQLTELTFFGLTLIHFIIVSFHSHNGK